MKLNSFIKSVRDTIIANRMVCTGDNILVAVSGGSDSIALLHVLHFLSSDFGINLSVAHLNHKLRGYDSEKDAFFVKSVVKKLKIPFYCCNANVLKVKQGLKLSLEQAARRIRYAFFNKLILKYSFSKLALAHHMDDNAEGILMFMLRGSGATGLSGIMPIRKNVFIRPFIRVRKFQILKFLLNEGIKYALDKSNEDLRFRRNKIRHSLMPMLTKSFNPQIIEDLNRTALILSAENEYLEHITEIDYNKVIITSNNNAIILSVPVINKLHIAIKRRIIRKAILSVLGSLKNISFDHVEAIIRLAKTDSGTKSLCLPHNLKIRKIYERLEIELESMNSDKVAKKSMSLLLNFKISYGSIFPLVLQDEYFCFKFTKVKKSDLPSWKNVSKHIAFLDLTVLQFPISIRYALMEDVFKPLGMKGSQKLKKYFTNKKIPLAQRSSALVIDDNGTVVWLVMHTICEYAKVTRRTKDVLMIEFYLLA